MKYLALLLLFVTGCVNYTMPTYFETETKNSPISYVKKIDHPKNNAFIKVWGICEMGNSFDNYPITILDSKRNSKLILWHEKIHRYEALQGWKTGYTNFLSDIENELGRIYDVEDLPDIAMQCLRDKNFNKKYIVWRFLSGDYVK